MSKRVLIVDDDVSHGDFLVADLEERGLSPVAVRSGKEALSRLAVEPFEVVLTDLRMPAMSGIELVQAIVPRFPDVPVVLMTAFASVETAVQAIRAGAYDYVTKPVRVDALELTLERAFALRSLRTEVRRLRLVSGAKGWGELTGASLAMQAVYDLFERIGDSDATVLITGESGTGKELCARTLHGQSKRRDGPFVAVNCAAIPESLMESELFGHVRGAFTDAKNPRDGVFVRASGGTLFFDEIGELPLAVQAKLLRAIQERVVVPVGGSKEVPFDVRILAATNRDLEALVQEKSFREDLYFRVHVIHIEMPPLRARGGDVLLLAQRLALRFAEREGKNVSSLSPEAAAKLLQYDWPGNVRELSNCMERAVALTRSEALGLDDLPPRVRDHRASHVLVAGDDPSELVPLIEVERRYAQRVLRAVSGNKTLAARILGIDRKTLAKKLGPEGDAT